MDFDLGKEQVMLQKSARDFLKKECPENQQGTAEYHLDRHGYEDIFVGESFLVQDHAVGR